MNRFTSPFGQRLFAALPAVYRERDDAERDADLRIVRYGSLARYLDALGTLLDRHRAAIEQRLADSFPDAPPDGLACQEWLIPYFARLLDVRLVGATADGQRAEVARAIRWRQAKGTLPTVRSIGAVIGGGEVEATEGWRRVITTARIGDPLIAARFYGVRDLPASAISLARHPGLAAATIDTRCVSRALRTTRDGPTVRSSRLGGARVEWIQSDPHAAPEQPGGFDDASRRTVDVRTPGWDRGYAHPRRVLIHAHVPRGLFAEPVVPLTAEELATSPYVLWEHDAATRTLRIRATTPRRVTVTGDLALPPAGLDLVRVVVEDLRIAGRIRVADDPVHKCHLELHRVVASGVEVATAWFGERAVLTATDCLLGRVIVRDGATALLRCTVRRRINSAELSARDSILAGEVRGRTDAVSVPAAGTVDHCLVPAGLVASGTFRLDAVVRIPARFLAGAWDDGSSALDDAAGVLSPAADRSLFRAATDGGELGVRRAHRRDPVVVTAPQRFALDATMHARLDGLVLMAPVDVEATSTVALVVERVAARSLTVATPILRDAAGRIAPVLDARSSLFDALTTSTGTARLEYCTVLGSADCRHLQASETIFAGAMRLPAAADCIRHSRVPAPVLRRATGLRRCTDAIPVFFAHAFGDTAPGVGVLHPAAPAALRHGAEDGGELGAHHDLRHARIRDAVIEKLADHLAVGFEAVLVPDRRLDVLPAARRPMPPES